MQNGRGSVKVRGCPPTTSMSQIERLASNGMDAGTGGENGELLSLKDNEEYQEDERSPTRKKSSSPGELSVLSLITFLALKTVI